MGPLLVEEEMNKFLHRQVGGLSLIREYRPEGQRRERTFLRELAVLAIATVPSPQPWLSPKRLRNSPLVYDVWQCRTTAAFQHPHEPFALGSGDKATKCEATAQELRFLRNILG